MEIPATAASPPLRRSHQRDHCA